jgi:hypothetical protein
MNALMMPELKIFKNLAEGLIGAGLYPGQREKKAD